MNRNGKKGIFISVLISFMILLSTAVFADSSADHGESIDSVLSVIRNELNLGVQDVIDPTKVSDALLEKLGEAVMSFRIPDPRQHEWMDMMMGSGLYGRGFGGTGMEGRFGDGNYRGWMAGYMLQDYEWIFPLLIVLLIIAVAIIIVMFVKRSRKADALRSDPLSLLKERYVKGEIDREAYMRMKNDLLGV